MKTMNVKIDLTKILKDCPKGTKFYTPVWGDETFYTINKGYSYPICIKTDAYSDTINLTKDGRYLNNLSDLECIIFPSKEQRDWSKFAAPWYKIERFDPYTLKAFDKVLAKNNSTRWCCTLFSHIRNTKNEPVYDCGGMYFRYCIPYNDDTKHLIGTTEKAPEYYRYWEE